MSPHKKGKRNKLSQRAHFLDKTVDSSHLKIINHGYLCVKDKNNKSGLSVKWHMITQVTEYKL